VGEWETNRQDSDIYEEHFSALDEDHEQLCRILSDESKNSPIGGFRYFYRVVSRIENIKPHGPSRLYISLQHRKPFGILYVSKARSKTRRERNEVYKFISKKLSKRESTLRDIAKNNMAALRSVDEKPDFSDEERELLRFLSLAESPSCYNESYDAAKREFIQRYDRAVVATMLDSVAGKLGHRREKKREYCMSYNPLLDAIYGIIDRRIPKKSHDTTERKPRSNDVLKYLKRMGADLDKLGAIPDNVSVDRVKENYRTAVQNGLRRKGQFPWDALLLEQDDFRSQYVRGMEHNDSK